jgi:hypothetical protein
LDRSRRLRCGRTITIPAGDGPFPVMISPSINAPGAGGFGGVALAAGYIAAGFAGNDGQNDANAYVPLYRTMTSRTCLGAHGPLRCSSTISTRCRRSIRRTSR